MRKNNDINNDIGELVRRQLEEQDFERILGNIVKKRRKEIEGKIESAVVEWLKSKSFDEMIEDSINERMNEYDIFDILTDTQTEAVYDKIRNSVMDTLGITTKKRRK